MHDLHAAGPMATANLALRFLLELAGIAGAAYWGWSAVGGGPAAIVAAIVAPLVLIGLWAMVVAPKARNAIGPSTRLLIGSALLLVVAAGVAFSGHGLLGAIFALLIGLNTGALVLVRR